MAKILSVAVLVLAIGLFPPAVAALVSNNAVPGDATYPIKRLLEDGIYAVASLTPTTKAWFAAARSDRRFKEFSTLIAQGKSASDTLNELVSQTDIAANELIKVEDPIRKEQLADQLLDSIKKYDRGLEQALAEAASPSPVVQQPIPQPTAAATVAPAQQKPSPIPASTAVSTPRPSLSIQPTTPPQPPPVAADAEDIEEARKKIEATKKKIEEERKKLKEEREEKRESRQGKKEESEEREHREKKKEDRNSQDRDSQRGERNGN